MRNLVVIALFSFGLMLTGCDLFSPKNNDECCDEKLCSKQLCRVVPCCDKCGNCQK